MNTELAKDGQQLQAAAFITIGQKDAADNECVRLSDLKVTGYEETFGYCMGSVWIDILDIDGSVPEVDGVPMSYCWLDYEDAGFPAGWYDVNFTPMADDQTPIGNAEDITFANGEGICFNTKDDYAGCQFIHNGQIVEVAIDYIAEKDGQQIAGNPLARTITLDELTVAGYEETFGYCMGSVWIDILDIDGSVPEVDGVPMSYCWLDYEDAGFAAGWYDVNFTPMVDDQTPIGNAVDIEFKAGEGICVNTKDDYAGCTLKFPALGLTK